MNSIRSSLRFPGHRRNKAMQFGPAHPGPNYVRDLAQSPGGGGAEVGIHTAIAPGERLSHQP